MAETENTETPEETTPAAEPEAPVTPPADDAPVEDAPAEPAEPAGPAPTAAEKRAAAKQQAASQRPARTHEERGREREKAKAAREADPHQPPAPPEHGPGRPKVRQGIVTSDKADKSITVRIDDARRHRRYEKIVRTSSKLHAHDEANDANTGDVVRVIESRPLSATKRWRLVEVLERAK